MKNAEKKSYMWTKENIRVLVNIWEKSTVEEIADKLDVDKRKVTYMANVIRKQGYPLSRKHVKSRAKIMIDEVMSELNINKQ